MLVKIFVRHLNYKKYFIFSYKIQRKVTKATKFKEKLWQILTYLAVRNVEGWVHIKYLGTCATYLNKKNKKLA